MSVNAGRQHARYAQDHAKRSGELAGYILSACLRARQAGEPLDLEQIGNLAHDIAESSLRAFLNAREAVRDLSGQEGS